MSMLWRPVAVVSCLLVASLLYAESTKPSGDDDSKTCEKQCEASKCAADKCKAGECDPEKCAKCSKRDGCPIGQAMGRLPKITFAVGDQGTCCSKEAQTLATRLASPVRYVVVERTFDTEPEAKLALAEETERFVAAFAEPTACKVSGTTTVAGKKHCCSKMAAQTAELVKQAMDGVVMAYAVGDKECHCPNEAAKLAEKSGSPKQFLVAGEKTCCGVTARLKLAQAKYHAAVVAIHKANPADGDSDDDSLAVSDESEEDAS